MMPADETLDSSQPPSGLGGHVMVRRTTDQVACDMGGEMVVLDLKSGFYYGLDAVGALVWSLIEQPASIAAVRDAVMAEYDVAADVCERDIRVFIDRMVAAGLVEIAREPDH